jgi:hypothetical protein
MLHTIYITLCQSSYFWNKIYLSYRNLWCAYPCQIYVKYTFIVYSYMFCHSDLAPTVPGCGINILLLYFTLNRQRFLSWSRPIKPFLKSILNISWDCLFNHSVFRIYITRHLVAWFYKTTRRNNSANYIKRHIKLSTDSSLKVHFYVSFKFKRSTIYI